MKRFLLCTCTAILLLSCSNDPACEPDNNDDAIKVSALIANIKPADRTTISGTGTASWADGDAIGVFCSQSKPAATNLSFAVSGVSSTPVWTPASQIYWADGTTAHTFLAYYPYASGNKTSGTNAANGHDQPVTGFPFIQQLRNLRTHAPCKQQRRTYFHACFRIDKLSDNNQFEYCFRYNAYISSS